MLVELLSETHPRDFGRIQRIVCLLTSVNNSTHRMLVELSPWSFRVSIYSCGASRNGLLFFPLVEDARLFFSSFFSFSSFRPCFRLSLCVNLIFVFRLASLCPRLRFLLVSIADAMAARLIAWKMQLSDNCSPSYAAFTSLSPQSLAAGDDTAPNLTLVMSSRSANCLGVTDIDVCICCCTGG